MGENAPGPQGSHWLGSSQEANTPGGRRTFHTIGRARALPGEQPGADGATYTQVPGVQLYLLLQLREQLVVKRLQLDVERNISSSSAGALDTGHPV